VRTMRTQALCTIAFALGSHAQSFTSGSTGADGPLDLLTPGTVVFDPASFHPQLDSAHGNVYHFTSIRIGRGVTVKLSSRSLNGPVFWLSQGPVQIYGTVDLGGEDGSRTPSVAGAGGYAGGAIGKPGYRLAGFTKNIFLVPLVGGDGGDGGRIQGGGAGGGALLIASSGSITIDGAINANGGASTDGTGGAGGAIRLVAPLIDGSGMLSARGGQPGGTDGRVRFEAFERRFSGDLVATPFSQGKPFGLFLPPNPSASVRVVSIGGGTVSGSEFTLNQTAPVRVVVEARFIPPGTIIQLEFFPETAPAQTVSTTPLEGTFELSHATALVTFSGGSTSSQVRTTWKQPTRGDQRP
jgi:hypothetical protein